MTYLTQVSKAPSLAGAVGRLAERARAESWTHEEFLAACLQRKVAARDAHGGEGVHRARHVVHTLEDYNYDHQRSLKRATTAHLSTLDFVTARDNAVFLDPPGTGEPTLSIGPAICACQAGHRVCLSLAFAIIVGDGRYCLHRGRSLRYGRPERRGTALR